MHPLRSRTLPVPVRLRLALALAVLPVCLGCHAAPNAFRGDQLDTLQERQRVAAEYWKRYDLPAHLRLEGKRAVVTEFVVEFITEKRESGGLITKRQTIVNVPAGYIGAGIEASGINRKVIEFDDALQQSLPDQMFASFAGVLRERGAEVVSPDRVKASSAYRGLLGDEREDTSFLQRLNPIASDTGRVLKAVYRPAMGLKPLDDDDLTATEASQLKLLEELNADVSIRARFRIGVFDGRASIDLGATIMFTNNQVAGSVNSIRSLLSEAQVVASRDFFPVKGDVLIIDSEQYRTQVLSLFPHFVAMGFDKPAGDELSRQ